MPVRITVEEGPHAGVSKADVVRRARAMLVAAGMPRADLSVLLTGDEQIRHLNRLYRNKDRPTDVLAFSQREGRIVSPDARLLGDVVVSVPTARRQAEARRRGLVAELTMLLAHGILHLLGWGHETVADDRRMRRETTRLCAAAEGATRDPPAPGSPRRPSTDPRVRRDVRRPKS